MRNLFPGILLFLSLLFSNTVFAQSSLCKDIQPFCAGDQRLTFPNSNSTNSNQDNGEVGPAYGCLEQQYYPAWFYLQIEDPGDLTFTISQYTNPDLTGSPLDVDFVVWGPFNVGDDFCNALTEDKIVDCSYLPDAVETMQITGARANEIYIVVITNFEKLPGYIGLQQTDSGEGFGSTDCSILDKSLGDFIPVCGADEYELNGYTDEAGSYEWYKKNPATGQYEKIPGADGPQLVVTESGDYKLVVADALGENKEEDEVTVTFYDIPEIGEASDVFICNETAETVDLTTNAPALIAPNPNPSEYEVVYFQNEEDLQNNIPISNPDSFPFTAGKEIFARVKHIEGGCLSNSVSFKMDSFNLPDFSLDEKTYFCLDANDNLIAPVRIGKDLGADYEYEWTFDGNQVQGPILTLSDFPGSGSIDLKITHKITGCTLNLSTLPVKIYSPADLTIEVAGSDFGDGYSLTAATVEAKPNPDAIYAYRLDDGNWQESNIFKEVAAGNHSISAREIHGCGAVTSENIFLVGYPRYFSPNSDGYNDSWKILNNDQITIKSLYIFDRYGKLLKQLGRNKGWDGTFNGKPLPADDYWFRIEFVEEKTGKVSSYSANFSLIR
ncbi:hypothetical protein C7S20_01655 [Christiangramia fulva]|uniref:Ig-like domain-containing protein n=1 Tax=Christiangramia fulva TaxID=2126553 RepID=A0A2R3Z1E5_9FLAO|nr:T9SS type B sorting domain-containing protein [Christiangramia fulva]AVR44068.1 hypothetical protein C7S20_01655 [Christiangramia fulva]